MKRFFLATGLFLTGIMTQVHTNASEVLDQRTVYTPDLNICVSSFGGLILSSEIKYFPEAKWRISKTKELLLRWIDRSNGSEFYLKQFDKSQFYWQFVETKKFIGAILTVTADSIQNEFYTSLGGGLNRSGYEFYGLRVPAELNGELFSFVINKVSYQLDYFENWKFAEPADAPLELTKFQSRNFLTNYELAALGKYSLSCYGLPEEQCNNVLWETQPGIAGRFLSVNEQHGFVAHLQSLSDNLNQTVTMGNSFPKSDDWKGLLPAGK
jgi:hypothetical protein